VFKNRHASELSKANSHARLGHFYFYIFIYYNSKQLLKRYSPVDEMMLAWFCLLMKAYLQWPHGKTQSDPTASTFINQEERRCCKTPAHTINAQSPMASVGESQMVDIAPVWYLQITESGLVGIRPIDCNVMLLQQFLPDKHTSDLKRVLDIIAGQWPDGAQGAWDNQLFPHNFTKCWAIYEILSKRTWQ